MLINSIASMKRTFRSDFDPHIIAAYLNFASTIVQVHLEDFKENYENYKKSQIIHDFIISNKFNTKYITNLNIKSLKNTYLNSIAKATKETKILNTEFMASLVNMDIPTVILKIKKMVDDTPNEEYINEFLAKYNFKELIEQNEKILLKDSLIREYIGKHPRFKNKKYLIDYFDNKISLYKEKNKEYKEALLSDEFIQYAVEKIYKKKRKSKPITLNNALIKRADDLIEAYKNRIM